MSTFEIQDAIINLFLNVFKTKGKITEQNKKGMYIYNLRILVSWYIKIGPFIINTMYNNCFRINGDKESTQATGYL